MSSSVGSLSSAEKITNTFHSEKKSKITRNTVAKFIDYLEDAFLISSASRYDIKGKRYIGAPKKFYFADLGLRNARLNFRQFEETRPFKTVRNSFKKIVVTKDFVSAFYDENGILTMNVIDFLMEPNSLISLG